MAVKLVFLGKLADLAGAPERSLDAPLDWGALIEALEGDLGDFVAGEKVKLAVNGTVVADKRTLLAHDGDEVALLPPVSGARVARDVRLLDHVFNPGEFVGAFTDAHPGLGGVCTFVGEVRSDDDVEALELSHYAPLTLSGMEALADRALARFDLMGVLIVHRVGVMRPGEPIVLVGACARHRRAAIQAVDYAMDHLKSDAWFWKREKRGGEWRWIEPRAEDHADRARWEENSAPV